MSSIKAYYSTLQPLTQDLTFDYFECCKDRVARISLEAQKWLTRVPRSSLVNSTLCGIPIEILSAPIALSYYLAFKANNWLIPGRVTICQNGSAEMLKYPDSEDAYVVDIATNNSVLGIGSASAFNTTSDDLTHASDQTTAISLEMYKVKENRLRCLADWLKCQVIVESNDPPLYLPLTRLMADFYASKQTYYSTIANKGPVVIRIPKTISNNYQIPDIVMDLCSARNDGNTILLTEGSMCRSIGRPETSTDYLAIIKDNLECIDISAVADQIGDNFNSPTKELLETVMHTEGWIETLMKEEN